MVLWNRVFGGSGADTVEAIAVDAGSNVDIAGTFVSDTLSFGGGASVAYAMGPGCGAPYIAARPLQDSKGSADLTDDTRRDVIVRLGASTGARMGAAEMPESPAGYLRVGRLASRRRRGPGVHGDTERELHLDRRQDVHVCRRHGHRGRRALRDRPVHVAIAVLS